jgi:hypothetical protein
VRKTLVSHQLILIEIVPHGLPGSCIRLIAPLRSGGQPFRLKLTSRFLSFPRHELHASHGKNRSNGLTSCKKIHEVSLFRPKSTFDIEMVNPPTFLRKQRGDCAFLSALSVAFAPLRPSSPEL